MTLGRPGVVAGELERRLDRLGAGVGEERPRASGIGARRGQPLAELGVGRVGRSRSSSSAGRRRPGRGSRR